MRRDTHALTRHEYDLVIIGAGIFGACAAWDAVHRGLSVALIEKSDFCQATSAHYFKMIHGGLRYLQHLDLRRTRESSHEQSTFFRVAPHLAYPLPIIMPTYGHGFKGKEILRVGFFLYEILMTGRNRNISDPKQKLPKARFISPQEVLECFPGLDRKNLSGGVLFYDGQVYNPPRLALSFIRSAVNGGLDAANYLEVTKYIQKGNRVIGVCARDFFSGNELEIRGKVVLNASGPWAHQLNEKTLGKKIKSSPTFSRDLVMVASRPLTKKYAFAHLVKSRDTDALFDRGGRHIFIMPWRGYSLIGVWHQVHKDSPEEIIVSDEELQRFVDEINHSYKGVDISLDDVTMVNTGLILFGSKNNQGEADNYSFGKRTILIDHSKVDNSEGLITLIGVRATMARREAEKAVDLMFKKLGRKASKSRTDVTPIYGGEIDNFEEFFKKAMDQQIPPLHAGIMRALIHNYGSQYHRVLKYTKEDPLWTETFENSTVLKAEVVHAVREEMAQKLEDVVFRRTDLGTAINPGEITLQSCAELMAKELKWGKARQKKELREVKSIFSRKGPWRRAKTQSNCDDI